MLESLFVTSNVIPINVVRGIWIKPKYAEFADLNRQGMRSSVILVPSNTNLVFIHYTEYISKNFLTWSA